MSRNLSNYSRNSKRSTQQEARTSSEIQLESEQREQSRKQRLLNALKRRRRIKRARARRWRIIRRRRWRRRKRALKRVKLTRRQRKKMESELMDRQMSIKNILRERRMRRQIRVQHMLRERRESQIMERQQNEMEEKALQEKLKAMKKVEREYDRMHQKSHLSAALSKLDEQLAKKKLTTRRVSMKGLRGNHFAIMRRLRKKQREEKQKINEIIEKLKEIALKREKYNTGRDTLESTKRETALKKELKLHLLKLDDEEEMEKQVTVQISKAKAAMSSKPKKRRFINKEDGKRKSSVRGTMLTKTDKRQGSARGKILTTTEAEQRESVKKQRFINKKDGKRKSTERGRILTTTEAEQRESVKKQRFINKKEAEHGESVATAAKTGKIKKQRRMSQTVTKDEKAKTRGSTARKSKQLEYKKSGKTKKLHKIDSAINETLVKSSKFSLSELLTAEAVGAVPPQETPEPVEEKKLASPRSITSDIVSIDVLSLPLDSDTDQKQNTDNAERSSQMEQNVQEVNAKQQKQLAKKRKRSLKEDRLSNESKVVEEKLSYWEKMQRKSTVERLRREEERKEFREERIDKQRKMRNKILDTLDKSKHELTQTANSDKMLRILRPEGTEIYRYSAVEDGAYKRDSQFNKWAQFLDMKRQKKKEKITFNKPKELLPLAQYYERPSQQQKGEERKSKFLNIIEILGEVERLQLKRQERKEERVSQIMLREREEEDERRSTVRQQVKKKAEIESDVIMAEKLKKKEEEIQKLVGSEFIIPEDDSNLSQTETKETKEKEHNEEDDAKEIGSIENILSSMLKKKKKRRKRLRPLTSQEKLIKFRYINANCCIVNGKRLDLRKCRESDKKIACVDPPLELDCIGHEENSSDLRLVQFLVMTLIAMICGPLFCVIYSTIFCWS